MKLLARIPSNLVIALALSGAAGLIYEIVWMRVIASVLQSTTYVLSLTFASVMLGMAIGGILGSYVTRRTDNPLRWYGIIEVGIGVYGALFTLLVSVLPHLKAIVEQLHSPFAYHVRIFIGVGLLLLIPAVLMGMSLPLVLSALKGKIGKNTGSLYAYNTFGAVFGALLSTLVFLPTLGTNRTILLAAIMSSTAGLIALDISAKKVTLMAALGLSLLALLTATSCGGTNPVALYTKGVCGIGVKNFLGDQKIIDGSEGKYGQVLVVQQGEFQEIKRLLVNGQGSSSLRLSDMRVSALSGYTPLLLKHDAKKSLVIGFGTGSASYILSNHTDTTTVEIEPQVIKMAKHFASVNGNVLTSPSHHVIYDDGRRFLEHTDALYDIIVNHPLDPFQSASSILFTKEFMKLAERRLSDKGVYVQWLPVYSLSDQNYADIMRTIRDTFPYYTAFLNLKAGEEIAQVVIGQNGMPNTLGSKIEVNGGELIIVASNHPLPDAIALEKQFNSLPKKDLEYLQAFGITDAKSLLNLLVFTNTDDKSSKIPGQLLIDDRPILEFAAPLNTIRHGDIDYKEWFTGLKGYSEP